MSSMNPFLKPVHATLTSEFQPYPELRERVNGMIKDGAMDAGIHLRCDYAWFIELVENGFAELKLEAVYRGKMLVGKKAYFRAL